MLNIEYQFNVRLPMKWQKQVVATKIGEIYGGTQMLLGIFEVHKNSFKME